MIQRVLIIEDEPISASRLKRLLGDYDANMKIEGPLCSIVDVVKTLQTNNNYDIIFADIRLQDGSVFDAFSMVHPQALVVFTTAYDEYALQAFKCNGIDYLLKPIEGETLFRTLHKVEKLMENFEHREKLIKENLYKTCPYRQRLIVIAKDEWVLLPVKDIVYIHVDKGVTMAHTRSGKSYVLQKSIIELEEQLDPNQFFRLNRQYLANIQAIKHVKFNFSGKMRVVLDGCDDCNIIVSKERTPLLHRWLDQ